MNSSRRRWLWHVLASVTWCPWARKAYASKNLMKSQRAAWARRRRSAAGLFSDTAHATIRWKGGHTTVDYAKCVYQAEYNTMDMYSQHT
ncbi:hypothetical protein BDV98DRAFT_561907 [Pterulicium gracile]|uniref:Secreted protein n=1 Tax=Pterulicium gracile TaxID=1884261 RepID=A0A5C3QVD3_9AGAR|nr:hypothetical protein BDV98DRAFT_561907 [Pterula gracilis]